MALTHVSRSFRRVVLDCPQLWMCLCRRLGRPGLEFIEACIKISGNQPLDVVLLFYRLCYGGQIMVVDAVLRTVLPHCARWRSCSFQRITNLAPCKEFIWLDMWPHNVTFPILAEFSILADHESFRTMNVVDFSRNSTWDVPGL